MAHFTNSLASFSNHVSYIRECLKAVRTREEAFDDLNRRRRAVFSKADSAEKKLQKMNPENKNLRQQTDILMALKEQIRGMDVEIMNEEASLADWKREKAREWMGALFGALSETSEKGVIVADYGRSIVSHIPTETTEPGLPRAPYSGHSQVEPLVVDAERELHRIVFSADIGSRAAPRSAGSGHNGFDNTDTSQAYGGVDEVPMFPPSPPNGGAAPEYSTDNLNEFGAYAPERRAYQTFGGETTQQPPNTLGLPPSRNDRLEGSGFTPGGGQFSTFSNSRPTEGFPSYNPSAALPPVSNLAPLTKSKPPSPPPQPEAKKDRRFSQRLSTSLTAAMGTGWAMDGVPRLDSSSQPMSPEDDYSRSPSSAGPPYSPPNNSQPVSALVPDVKSRERRLSNRMSQALGGGWNMDGGAPRLDASTSLAIDDPPARTSFDRSTSPSEKYTPSEGAEPVKSRSSRISKRMSSALGSGYDSSTRAFRPESHLF